MSLVWLHDETLSEEHTEESGYVWTINEKSKPDTMLEVFHSGPEDIGLRLEEDGQVDLMILSHGQSYDLLKALTRALGVTS